VERGDEEEPSGELAKSGQAAAAAAEEPPPTTTTLPCTDDDAMGLLSSRMLERMMPCTLATSNAIVTRETSSVRRLVN
jgi:hypothetical protein